ncbi:DUF924 family protein [Ramlibacter humi]|uniref:DUF924 family protein n=1 Tax=Ramlibacter humi TaxID=2530451 RepID=A0A4Z0CB37_9BURK|nr:DUF924 family protein [Ramlibacter humi]TFZ08122.1 DUF924 family protein [Ramlibacter humi]
MPETQDIATPEDVCRFWSEAGPQRWYQKDEAFDTDFRHRFLPSHEAAARGGLMRWAASPGGALALLILLDQFPRNAFRDTGRVYATDALARVVAQQAMQGGHAARCRHQDLKQFFRMPFTHSEWLPDQERALSLAREEGGDGERWARHHRDIVARFGRFPHRNALLGRRSTPEELAFLEADGFKG